MLTMARCHICGKWTICMKIQEEDRPTFTCVKGILGKNIPEHIQNLLAQVEQGGEYYG